MGLCGIVVGIDISSVASLIMIMVWFKNSYGYNEKVKTIVVQYFKSVLVALASMVVVCVTKNIWTIIGGISSILVYGIEVVLVYTNLTRVFNKKVLGISKQI